MNLENYFRKHIKNIPSYEGVDPSYKLASEAGIQEDKVIKLNANENPFGKELGLGKKLSEINIHEYPDPLQKNLRTTLATYTGRKYEEIVAGSGSDELIDLLIRIFLEKGDILIDVQPTFGMYEFSAQIQGAKVCSVSRRDDFEIDLDTILHSVSDKTKMIFLASPNNPTGNILSEPDLVKLLQSELIVVIDETYYEFCNISFAHLIDKYENLIILRSFSKWSGLAGLRIGYAISNPKVIEKLILIKQPYNINSAAETVALEAISKKDFLLEKVKILLEQRDKIFEFLQKKTDIKIYPSYANFLLVDFGAIDANMVFETLAKNGIFVRKFSHPMISNSLRISSGTPEQIRILLQVLDKFIK